MKMWVLQIENQLQPPFIFWVLVVENQRSCHCQTYLKSSETEYPTIQQRKTKQRGWPMTSVATCVVSLTTCAFDLLANWATKWLTHGFLGNMRYPLGWLIIPSIITSLGYIPYCLGTHGLTYTYLYATVWFY